jgi:hypothetical protein
MYNAGAVQATLPMMNVKVTLEGLTSIMFDRYPGNNNINLPWHEKLYLAPGTNVVSLPVININSFFTALNSMSAPKRLLPSKAYKNVCNACMSFLQIRSLKSGHPDHVPFQRNGKDIVVGSFNSEEDPKSGVYLARHVARLKDGIPNPKERPVLSTPWSLVFQLSLIDNTEITLPDVKNLLKNGGETIGFGTFRGYYGKFHLAGWEAEE